MQQAVLESQSQPSEIEESKASRFLDHCPPTWMSPLNQLESLHETPSSTFVHLCFFITPVPLTWAFILLLAFIGILLLFSSSPLSPSLGMPGGAAGQGLTTFRLQSPFQFLPSIPGPLTWHAGRGSWKGRGQRRNRHARGSTHGWKKWLWPTSHGNAWGASISKPCMQGRGHD